MRRLSQTAPVEAMYLFGAYHLVVLDAHDETRGLVEDFTEVNDGLLEARQKRLDAERALATPRAMVQIVDKTTDDLVRLVARGAEMEDGGRRGAMFDSVFPDGITPIVVPIGAGEVKALKRLIDRLEKSPKAASLREEWMPRLVDAKARYEKALADRVAAYEVVSRARTGEVMARDSWHDAVARHQGFLQMTYPRDRRMQDLFFPPSSARARATGEDAQAEEGEEGAAGEGGDASQIA